MANGHGGARDRAGRKPAAERNLGRSAEAEGWIAADLETIYGALRDSATGQAVRVSQKYVRAGSEYVTDVARFPPKKGEKVGQPILDSKGKPTLVQVRKFPDVPEDELILIEETRVTLPPDTKAGCYLWDRHSGRAREAEPKGNGELDTQEAMDRAHGRAEAYRDPDDGDGTEPGPEADG